MRGLTTRAGLVAALAFTALAGSASAATLKVNRTGDPVPGVCTRSDCTLREAVRRANGSPGPDEIVLKARTSTLQQAVDDDEALVGDLDVAAGSGQLTIVGKGAGKTTIDGNDVDRILHVLAGARLRASLLTLRDGHAINGGGALQNDGSTVIQRAAVRSNTADNIGGGLHNNGDGNLVVKRTRITGNDATSRGGGVHTYNTANATLQRVVVRGNQAARGAGLYNENESVLVVRKSTIHGNSASDDGGGLFNQNDAQARIKASTLSGNTASDDGGAIFTQNDSSLTLTNATLSGNRAGQEGGAIYGNNWPYIRINFSTIAKNSAATSGGAIFDQTSSVNPMRPPPFWLIRGTIIARNSSPGVDNCVLHEDSDPSHHDSQGSNLEDENSCFFDRRSDERNANPRLRRLARNGGPTKTHALKPGSDAIDAARARGCPRRDQRGVRRPQGRRCDIGSFELKRRRR